MAATTANAVKLFIEGQGLGITAVRDRSEGKTYPFVEIREAVSKVVSTISATFETGKKQIIEMVQIDLYQLWRNPDGTMAEQYGLADSLADKLDGSALVGGAPPTKVYGVRVVQGPMRMPDLEPNLVRDTITIEIDRDRT